MSRRALELPTLLLVLVIHGGWLALTWAASAADGWRLAALVPLAGFVVAWHGSLQHEIIHGHPTRWRALNTLCASLPIGLLLPFRIYREQHLAHHGSSRLTDPTADPESFFVTRAWWQSAGPLRRAFARAQATAVGRLVLGPPMFACRFLGRELGAFVRGDFRHASAWAVHVVGIALVVAWLKLVCGMSLARYVLCFVYPGMALTLLRSFAEHRPAPNEAERNAIVEASPLAGLLYLNNNLHAVHHDAPALPWYELPARYARERSDLLARNGGYVLPGYLWVLTRYGFRAKDTPIHPDT